MLISQLFVWIMNEFCENQIMIVNIDELELTDALKACYDRLTLSDHYNHKLTKLTHSLTHGQEGQPKSRRAEGREGVSPSSHSRRRRTVKFQRDLLHQLQRSSRLRPRCSWAGNDVLLHGEVHLPQDSCCWKVAWTLDHSSWCHEAPHCSVWSLRRRTVERLTLLLSRRALLCDCAAQNWQQIPLPMSRRWLWNNRRNVIWFAETLHKLTVQYLLTFFSFFSTHRRRLENPRETPRGIGPENQLIAWRA